MLNQNVEDHQERRTIDIYAPEIDEYGFADFGTGDQAVPTRYLFAEGEYSETTPGGDVEPEYWKEIAKDYWISNLGNVYSFKSNKPMKVSKNVGGKYPALRLCFGNKNSSKLITLHRLLAENFVPNPDNLPVVRHLNDDPDDYDLENLAWGTSKDNWKDAINNGKLKSINKEAAKKGQEATRKPIRITDLRTGEQRIYPSLHEAARQTGYDVVYICNWLKGKWNNNNWKLEYI